MKRINQLAFLSLCGALLMLVSSCKQAVHVEASQPVKVNICVIDTLSGKNIRTYVGEVEENMSLALGFTLGGRVEKVLVREGDRVQAGQLLATVNATNAQNAYHSAKAQLEQAEDAYRRLKKVYDQGSLAEVKWVEMLTNLEKARSLEQIAKKQLSECSMYAPAAGVVGKCNVRVGESILPGEPAITLLDLNRVDVTFAVPESEISSIPVGSAARILIPALNNQMLEGKISDKSMTSNPVAHSYEVKISLPNAKKQLLPGMVCKVYINQDEQSGFVIPARCVQTRPEGLGIWVIEKGKPVRRIVEVADYVVNGVVVTSGVNVGDTIVTDGIQKLYTGANVTIE